MRPMFEDPVGNILMIVMFVNIILGSWLMSRLAKIDF
jgi:Flp pilus assembly protein TadB